MMSEHPLIEYGKRSGRTTTEIAKAARVSRMTIYRLIRGEQNATIDLLQRVSDATGGEVSVGSLLISSAPANSERASA